MTKSVEMPNKQKNNEFFVKVFIYALKHSDMWSDEWMNAACELNATENLSPFSKVHVLS